MALTDLSSAAAPARIIRPASDHSVDRHAFSAVTDLPTVPVGRPQKSGNPALDALRVAAWDEGFAEGRSVGIDDGFAAGHERGAEEGRRVGYLEGQALAHQDAVSTVESRFSDALAALDTAAGELAAHDRMVLGQMETAVVDLALAVAQAILEREIAVAAEPGRDAIRRALALAPDHDTYLVRLNPADLDSIGEVSDLAPGRSLELAADPSVTRGGCVIEAGAARIDARIEGALARVREVLQP